MGFVSKIESSPFLYLGFPSFQTPHLPWMDHDQAPLEENLSGVKFVTSEYLKKLNLNAFSMSLRANKVNL